MNTLEVDLAFIKDWRERMKGDDSIYGSHIKRCISILDERMARLSVLEFVARAAVDLVRGIEEMPPATGWRGTLIVNKALLGALEVALDLSGHWVHQPK